MQSVFKSFIFASTLSLACNANAALVSLSFNAIAPEVGTAFAFSTLGDSWRATNVRVGGGAAMDAIFTITSTTGISNTDNVRFVNDEAARGDNMRVRIGGTSPVGDASVRITINLVNAGTNLAYTGFAGGDTLTTQFSDLDSDVGADRADYAGALNSQYVYATTSDAVTPGSSLLDLISSPSYASGYTVGILKTPWTSQGDVTDTSEAAQAPVTAAFLFDQRTSINIVLGQESNGGALANRHLDIDMTHEFVIIPEPSVALLGGLGLLAMLRRRR